MRSNSTLRSSRVRVALLQLLAQRAEQLHRDRVLVAVALLDREPDPARQRGARAAGRDRDREVAAAHDRGQDEVAQVRDVDDVAEHLARLRVLEDAHVGVVVARSRRSPGSSRRGRRSRRRAARARSVLPRPSARTCSVASSETTRTLAPASAGRGSCPRRPCRRRPRAPCGRPGRGSPGSSGGSPSARPRLRQRGEQRLDAPGAVLAVARVHGHHVARSRRFSASSASSASSRSIRWSLARHDRDVDEDQRDEDAVGARDVLAGFVEWERRHQLDLLRLRRHGRERRARRRALRVLAPRAARRSAFSCMRACFAVSSSFTSVA